jgi:uncharacterized membrane protein YidH (DUF202 family)
MSASQQTPKDRDVRDYLAAEQTFLAWIRTIRAVSAAARAR